MARSPSSAVDSSGMSRSLGSDVGEEDLVSTLVAGEVGDSGGNGEAEGGCLGGESEGGGDGFRVVFIGPYPVGVDVHEVEVTVQGEAVGLVADPVADQPVSRVEQGVQRVEQVQGHRRAPFGGQQQGVLGLLDLDGAGEDLLAADVELLAVEGQFSHVEADLLDDLVSQQHVGTAGALVLDLVGPVLVPLGPAVDRRLELQAELLDAGRGVEPEQAWCGPGPRRDSPL